MLEGLQMPVETFEANSYESAKSIMDETSNIDMVFLKKVKEQLIIRVSIIAYPIAII